MAEHGGDKTALNGAQFKCCRRINVNEGNLINKVGGKENSTTKNCLDHIQVSKISTGKIIVNNTRLLKSLLSKNLQMRIHHIMIDSISEVARINHSPEPSETVTIILVIVALLLVILIVMGVYWMKKMIQRRDLVLSAQMSDLVNSTNNAKENIYCTLE